MSGLQTEFESHKEHMNKFRAALQYLLCFTVDNYILAEWWFFELLVRLVHRSLPTVLYAAVQHSVYMTTCAEVL